MKSFFAFTVLALASAHGAETFAFYHENVLGTSLELRVSAESVHQAKAAEAKVLSEIDRLSGILSTWKSDSEISRWQTSGQAVHVSPDLATILTACDTWSYKTQGSFNAGVGAAGKAWKAAVATGQPPSAEQLNALCLKNGQSSWSLSGDTATCLVRPGDITVDGLAKGYIIDRAVESASADGQINGLMLNIGGDLRVSGDWSEAVAIADPQQPAENAVPLTTIRLKGLSLATSGDYRRGYDIAGRHYSHIIDPRTATPVDHVMSASVVAPDATTADALATAFNVLQPAESLAIAEKTPGVSCLIVSSDGRKFRSSKWDALTEKPQLAVAATGQPMELTVDFELNRPETERYLRPYLAIWLEDKDAYPVRTLNLWILKGEKGLRWLPDLKRWSKADKLRRLADPTDVVPTISSATRNPGNYSVVWDGLDDHKQPLPAGEYTLYIEAVREKGSYQLMKHVVNVGGEAFKATLKGNEEIKSAVLDYHQKKTAN